MAIKDFFKAKPEPERDRERALRDPEQILAWLEELSRLRTVLELTFGEDVLVPLTGKLERVGEESRTFTLSLQRGPKPEPQAGQRGKLVFALDGQRFQTELIYKERGGYLQYQFKLPIAIYPAERRDSTRVPFRSREKHKIVVLQDLFDGMGLSGELVNLSMGGCAFLVQRAIRVKDEKRLPLRDDLLTPGTPLAVVRLPDLPRLPLVECGGRVASLRQGPNGVLMGLAFENLGAFETGILDKFMTSRVPGFHVEFPWKRRFKDLTDEERLLPQPAVTHELEEPLLPLPCAEDPEPGSELLPAGAEGATEDDGTELKVALQDGDRLNKLRKRGKKILLVFPDALQRTILMSILHQDGYRCLFEASSLVKALEALRKIPLDLLILDQEIGAHGALDVLTALRNKGLQKAVPVVVVQRQMQVRLTLAAKAGAVNMLLEHPFEFETALKAPLEAMLGLDRSERAAS